MRMRAPRLLPPTIVAILALLAMKSVELVRAAVPAAADAQTPPTAPKPVGPPPQGVGLPAGPANALHSPPAAPPQPGGAALAEAPVVSPGERKVLLELRERRRELDSREAAINDRASVLAAAQKKLEQSVVAMEGLQKHLEQLEADRKERQSESWQGLVSLYEKMKAREAAQIFDDLETSVLLQIVDRMKDSKAAPILAAMHPDKAREVTARLAEMRTHRDSVEATK